MAEIPKAVVERLIRKSGASRVAGGAVEEMTKVLEEVCNVVSKEAIRLSKHAGRQTVKDADIKESVVCSIDAWVSQLKG